jgi:hypothetical protein
MTISFTSIVNVKPLDFRFRLNRGPQHVRITFHPRNPLDRCRRDRRRATVERSEVSVEL